ncbi:glycosyltransferase family 39 protein [Candidatus Woesearchaeota archaeon]|nr:glycosyltransferase family 39 protein [Candidatus Woesearchaeota archaeon]
MGKRKGKKIDVWLISVIILFLLTRLIISFTSFRYADGEEAVYGVMAKEIIERGDRPLLCWGQAYSGACAIHGYLATLPYFLFGNITFTVRIFNILFSLGTVIFSYFFVKKFFSRKAAILASLLLIFSSDFFIKFNLIHFPYMLTLFFQITIALVFFGIIHKGRKSWRNFALFGFLCGLSLYSLELIAPFLVLCAFFWFLHDNKFFLKKSFVVFLLFLIIGLSPLIYYNATTNFANVKQFFAGTIFHKAACEFRIIPQEIDFNGRTVNHCELFSTTRRGNSPLVFISKMVPELYGRGIVGIINYGMIVLLTLFLVIVMVKDEKGIVTLKKVKKIILKKESFIILFTVLFPFADFFSGFADTRHLLPLFPFVQIIISLAVLKIYDSKSKIRKAFASLIIIVMIISFAIGYIQLLNDKTDYDETEVIRFLNENGIKNVYTTTFIQWRLVFQSDEDIIASCNDICPPPPRYPLFDAMVESSAEFAYVFIPGHLNENQLNDYLAAEMISFKKEILGNRAIYYDFSRIVRPSEFVKDERTVYGE